MTLTSWLSLLPTGDVEQTLQCSTAFNGIQWRLKELRHSYGRRSLQPACLAYNSTLPVHPAGSQQVANNACASFVPRSAVILVASAPPRFLHEHQFLRVPLRFSLFILCQETDNDRSRLHFLCGCALRVHGGGHGHG